MEGQAEQPPEAALEVEAEGHQAREGPVQEPSRDRPLDGAAGEARGLVDSRSARQVLEHDGGAEAVLEDAGSQRDQDAEVDRL